MTVPEQNDMPEEIFLNWQEGQNLRLKDDRFVQYRFIRADLAPTSQWRDISSAPRDGGKFIISDDYDSHVVHWRKDRECFFTNDGDIIALNGSKYKWILPSPQDLAAADSANHSDLGYKIPEQPPQDNDHVAEGCELFLEDAVTREDTVPSHLSCDDDVNSVRTSSTTDGDAERALEIIKRRYVNLFDNSSVFSYAEVQIILSALQTRTPPAFKTCIPETVDEIGEWADAPVTPVPVDTISIKIEELLRIKMVLERCSLFNLNEIVHERVRVAIATLDAVLSEGK